MSRGAKLSVDIGGTFTDVVLEDGGELTSVKVLTTYEDPASGVMAGAALVLQETGVQAQDISLVLHGTTLATNALIERAGARTALLTTAGHRDVLEMALENRFEQYDVNVRRPEPLVPRTLRLPITERLGADGSVLVPLDESSVDAAIDTLRETGVESVAIGFLHAYADDRHERRVADLVSSALPHIAVTLASDVCPEVREYERFSTAVANAYVQPLMCRYLDSLESQLREQGITAPVLLMSSGGGLTTLDAAKAYPIRLVESGPAGGAQLAAALARRSEWPRVLSFDMGGTTAKICLIDDGEPQLSRSFEVDRIYRFKKGSGLPVRIPVVEMVEIGAGGGSLAAVDRLGRVTVGPESAASEPGPACYGLGGERPAVTDADLLLGKLPAEGFAGGRVTLDERAATEAVARHVGSHLGLEDVPAAWAISETVDESMALAARAHASEWGRSVEDRTLIAFGGAAPLHAARLAEKLRMKRVVVPENAGVGSAVGFLLAPISFEVVRSAPTHLDALSISEVQARLDDMRREASAVVAPALGDSPVKEVVRAYMRYVGQGFELAVEVPPIGSDFIAALRHVFEENYRALYGQIIPGQSVELLSWTLSLQSESARPRNTARSVSSAAPVKAARLFDGSAWQQLAVFPRSALETNQVHRGPALVVEAQTTTVVPAGFRFFADQYAQIVLERDE